jgi:hypothetical protein
MSLENTVTSGYKKNCIRLEPDHISLPGDLFFGFRLAHQDQEEENPPGFFDIQPGKDPEEDEGQPSASFHPV